MNRPRRNWPSPGETPEERQGAPIPPPPLTTEEEQQARISRSRPHTVPLSKPPSPPVLRRTFAALLAAGFCILTFYLALQLIQTVHLLLSWPAWMGWPVLALIFLFLGFALFRMLRLFISLRTLPKVPKLAKGEFENLSGNAKAKLRDQFLSQLDYLETRNEDRTDGIQLAARELKETAVSHPVSPWLQSYERRILKPLGQQAKTEVRRIAISAGASAALSPWKILDAIIAFNAAAQTANEVLRIHGIRPTQATAFAFAFDTFLNTFLATVVEDVSEDLVDSLTAQISAESGASLVNVLAPKIAEGLTTAVFVRRLGNRMIRRLHPFDGI